MNLQCAADPGAGAPWGDAWVVPETLVNGHADVGPVAMSRCSGVALTVDDDALAALVLRVCDQDETALSGLYEATSGRVYGLVQRIVRQTSVAEEVVEDVYWQVWREAPRFNATRGNVVAWLLAIARSRAIDALRRQHRQQIHEVAVDCDILEGLADEPGRDDPFDLVDVSQHHALLQSLLVRLEPLPRQLLALAFFRGCTHEEISEQTGLALGTVKSHIRRTLALLRDQLATVLAAPERRTP
jgi:RNA polymerase sigma-70 factor (ECF subfamily)